MSRTCSAATISRPPSTTTTSCRALQGACAEPCGSASDPPLRPHSRAEGQIEVAPAALAQLRREADRAAADDGELGRFRHPAGIREVVGAGALLRDEDGKAH